MPVVMIENFDEWRERHGGASINIGRNRLLCPDGATCDEYGHVRHEPPENDYDRLRLVRKYHQEVLNRVTDDFHRLKAALTGRGAMWSWPASRYGEPPADGPSALRHLKSLVDQSRAELKHVDREIAATPEAKELRREQRMREELEREQAQDDAELQEEINAIRLDDEQPDDVDDEE